MQKEKSINATVEIKINEFDGLCAVQKKFDFENNELEETPELSLPENVLIGTLLKKTVSAVADKAEKLESLGNEFKSVQIKNM